MIEMEKMVKNDLKNKLNRDTKDKLLLKLREHEIIGSEKKLIRRTEVLEGVIGKVLLNQKDELDDNVEKHYYDYLLIPRTIPVIVAHVDEEIDESNSKDTKRMVNWMDLWIFTKDGWIRIQCT
jgi:hypothetical protein